MYLQCSPARAEASSDGPCSTNTCDICHICVNSCKECFIAEGGLGDV